MLSLLYLWRRFCGNGTGVRLEHREADLVDLLPPPRRMDWLALTVASSISPVSGSASEMDPLQARPLSFVMPLSGTRASSLVSTEDSKEGIIVDARRMQAKSRSLVPLMLPRGSRLGVVFPVCWILRLPLRPMWW